MGERLVLWLRGHPSLVDAVVAAALVAVCGLFGLLVRAEPAYFVLSALLLVPLAWRRGRPELTAALVLAAALLQWLTVRDTVGALPADLAVPMVVHAAAAYGRPVASRVVLAAGVVGAVLGGLSWPLLPVTPVVHVITGAFLASVVVAAWALGALQGARRRQLAIERDQRDRLAVQEERTRIAREMHDVVAHTLVVLIAQADGGRYATAPDAGKQALETIAEHGRAALAEMRRVVGVLREAPAPGVEDVTLLVDRVRAAGLDVALTFQPPEAPVDAGLALAAYRIVQEGLTNVIKHAGPGARAEVAVRWGPRRLEIDVLDDGAQDLPPSGGGHGVAGMRERAGVFGGTVTLGPRPGGGRVLRARIPR